MHDMYILFSFFILKVTIITDKVTSREIIEQSAKSLSGCYSDHSTSSCKVICYRPNSHYDMGGARAAVCLLAALMPTIPDFIMTGYRYGCPIFAHRQLYGSFSMF